MDEILERAPGEYGQNDDQVRHLFVHLLEFEADDCLGLLIHQLLDEADPAGAAPENRAMVSLHLEGRRLAGVAVLAILGGLVAVVA